MSPAPDFDERENLTALLGESEARVAELEATVSELRAALYSLSWQAMNVAERYGPQARGPRTDGDTR